MKFLDPILRKFGYQRIQKRSFEAARSNRLTTDWNSQGFSLDAILSGQGDTLRNRARDLGNNNEYFQGFLRIAKCNIIGHCGMTLKNKAAEPIQFQGGEIRPGKLDKLANKLIEDAWWEWGKKENCTTAKNLTWLQVQQLAVEEWATCGETLWEMVFGAEADNKFGFALRPIVIDRLHTLSNYNLSNGDRVRLGVQKNKDGRVLFYWITDSDPTDVLFRVGNAFNPKAYDASRYVHLFLPRRIGQSRGVPWSAAPMLRLKMLAGYDIATITGAETAACNMAFLTKNGTGQDYAGPKADDGGKYMDAEPGVIHELPLGMGVQVVDWKQPSAQYDPFTKACLRGIATGLGVSYPTLASDYAEVNFSSGRMARMEEKEFWKFAQASISSDFHEPIFGKWLQHALLNQAIAYPMGSGKGSFLPASRFEKFNQPNFHGRRWEWVDPTKEVGAKAEELRLKLTSHTRICAELGVDRDELFAEIRDDKEAAELQGITLPDEAELAAAAQKLAEQDAQAAQHLDADGNPIEQTEGDGERMNPEQFKITADAYGVAVRAGAITPNEADEQFFRSKLGMAGNEKVAAAWKEDEGIRRPITLQSEATMGSGFGQPSPQTDGEPDDDKRFHLNGNSQHH